MLVVKQLLSFVKKLQMKKQNKMHFKNCSQIWHPVLRIAKEDIPASLKSALAAVMLRRWSLSNLSINSAFQLVRGQFSFKLGFCPFLFNFRIFNSLPTFAEV